MATDFTHQTADITPELALAVGRLTIEWAIIESNLNQTLSEFLKHEKRKTPPPRSFDKRCEMLIERVSDLYASNALQLDKFLDFIQRVKTVNGKRDAVAHGIPGTINHPGKNIIGLIMPNWFGGKTKHVPMTTPELNGWAAKATALKRESHYEFGEEIRHAFLRALPQTRP